ncbi:MAG: flagellar filament capping protein FliD [Acidobacteriota bacterium]|nr:flagellar filament capping protein FliD [Acidobacteriota bacterium]
MSTSSTSATSSSINSTVMFNGNSRYASDFQAVINRAVAIASLPITAMNSDKTDLTNQTTALTDLQSKFNTLQSALGGITAAVSGSSYDASVSDPSKVSVSLSDGALEGTYSVDVIDAGAYATSLSKASWAADTGTHTYQLSIGGQNYSLSPADNSAASVVAAINSQYGDKVRATMVNVGSSSAPDYRISLQATSLGGLQPDILKDGASQQTQQTQGVQAHYIVNGSGLDVYSSSRSVTVAAGVTVSLLASDAGTPTEITVTRSTAALSSALSNFASAYNAAATALDAQRGTGGGALTGQSIVTDLQQVLRQISSYAESGSVGGLASLGLDLDKTGQMTFNSLVLMGTELTASTAVSSFLGSSTSGFLKAAQDALTSVDDVTTGLLPMAQSSLADESSRLDQSISDTQARVDNMQTQMQTQMAAADALIASMEQQYNYLYGLFSSMQTASQQYK